MISPTPRELTRKERHVHGNTVFGKKAMIIAQDNVRKRIATDTQFDGKPGTRAPKHALPIITWTPSGE